MKPFTTKLSVWVAFLLAFANQATAGNQGQLSGKHPETKIASLAWTAISDAIPPVAQFSVDAQANCTGLFYFTDLSQNLPDSWLWDFGDGATDASQSPSHQYGATGNYTVILTVTNAFGSDTASIVLSYFDPSPPVPTGNLSICQGISTVLSAANIPGYTTNWLNAAGTVILGTGPTYATPALNATTSYNARYVQNMPVLNVGSTDIQANGGNYVNNSPRGLLFTATTPFTLISAQVNATGAGNRTFNLYDAGGAVIQTVVVNVPSGISRVNLNFNIPAAGNYSVGGANMNLWRNNTGVAYPYDLPGVVSIYGSNGGGATNYYFLYDWEVAPVGCNSPLAPVTVNVLPLPTAAFGTSVYANTATFTDQSTGATSWYWDFGDGAWDVAQNPAHTYGAPGIYDVMQIVSSGTCYDSLTQIVDVVFAIVPPIAQINVDAQIHCNGLFEFTDQSQNMPTDWLWDFGDGTTDTQQNPTHQYVATGDFTVLLTVTNLFGTDTATLHVTNTAPLAPTPLGDLSICPGASTTLTVAEIAGYNAVWYDSNGLMVAKNDTFNTPFLNVATGYSVRYEEMMPSQSVGSSNLQANGSFYDNALVRTLLFTAATPFNLLSARVNAATAGNRTFNLYDAGGAIVQTVTVNVPVGISRIPLNFNIPSAGNYSVGGANMNLWRNDAAVTMPYNLPGVVSIYSTNVGVNLYYYLYDWEVSQLGCYSATVPVTVDVLPGTSAAFTWIVNAATATFADQSANATTWQWDFGDGQTSTQQNPSNVYAISGSYSVTLIVTDGNCADTLTQTVNVIFATQPPIAQAYVNVNINCSGLFVFSDQSLNVPDSWFWDFGDGITDTTQNPSHQYSVPGIYTVDLVVSNLFGTSSASVQINYDAPDAPSPMGDLAICNGASTVLSVAANPGYTTVWYDSTGILLSANDVFSTPNLVAPTSYSVQYKEDLPVQHVGSVNLQGTGGFYNDPAIRLLLFQAFAPFTMVSAQVNAQTASVRSFVLYDVNGVAIQTVMVNVPAGVSRIPLYFDIPSAGYYGIGGANMDLWRNIGGAVYPYTVPGVVSIYSTNSPANQTSSYFFLYDWEVSPTTCNSPIAQVMVNTSGPTAAFAWSHVHADYTFADQSTGAVTWEWDFGDGTTSTSQSPTHTYPAPGAYNVTLAVSNGTCLDTLVQVVDVIFATQWPYAYFVVNAEMSCSGNFAFTDRTQFIPDTWLWDFGDETNSTDQNPIHQYSVPGIYTVILTASNPLGSDTYTFEVNYNAPEAPVVTGSLNLCEGDSTVLTTVAIPGNITRWTDGNGDEIAVGNTLTTPALFSATTYQVTQTRDAVTGYVGSLNIQVNGGFHTSPVLRTLLFTAHTGLTIVSADVNSPVAGDRTFSLYDAAGTTILQSVTVMVPAGFSRINLGLVVPESGHYQIGGLDINLWRNSTGAIGYPFSLPGVLDITRSNADPNPQNYYYYLYDWEVLTMPCEGFPTLLTVNVSPSPVANFTCSAVNEVVTFTDLSLSGTSWFWDFGDGTTDSTQNPVHNYTAVGNYNVQLTVTNGSCSETISHPCDVLFIGIDQPNAHDFRLFPNPANGQITIQLSGYILGNESVEVFAADGRLVIQSAWASSGSNSMTLDCSNLAAGTYMARVQSADGVMVKRFGVRR